MDACAKEFANHRLDPLRGKIPIWREEPTDEMRKNENKPNAAEKNALRAYYNAEIACNKSFSADQVSTANSRHTADIEINPLRNGKITFAEYIRRHTLRQDQINNDVASMVASYPGMENWTPTPGPSGPTPMAATVATPSGPLAVQKVVSLNCLLTVKNGQSREIALTIDYTNMQVSGHKAEFYENEIRWEQGMDDGSPNYHSILNRLSGFLTVGDSTVLSIFTGRCAPAAKRF